MSGEEKDAEVRDQKEREKIEKDIEMGDVATATTNEKQGKEEEEDASASQVNVEKKETKDEPHDIDYVTELKDFQALGSTPKERIEAAVNAHGVVIFSKSHCPFCFEVKETFKELRVEAKVVELDKDKGATGVQKALQEMTGQKTVPNVFVNGKSIGGCSDTKALQASGKLDEMLEGLVVKSKVKEAKTLDEAGYAVIEPKQRLWHPFFWFPHYVQNDVVRLTGVQVVALCILGIIFRRELWGKYLAVFLLFDFVSRLLFGASVSVLGLNAMLISFVLEKTLGRKPIWRPGFPKQFASSCGTMFAATAVGCYFGADNYSDGSDPKIIAGATVLGLLAGAAGLEGFADFCVGCLFFGWGIRFNLLPKHLYKIYNNTRDETAESWNYVNLHAKTPYPEPEVDKAGDRPNDLVYKKKSDEYTRDDFHIIRNVQVGYFVMPMGIAGLALPFALPNIFGISQGTALNVIPPRAWYETFAYIAAILYCALVVLYTTRIALYPKKCLKEWHCPLRSNAFGAITITLILFSILVQNNEFGRVLFWLGSVPHMVMTVWKMGEWIGRPLEEEHVHPNWMIFPLGNMVAAIAAPIVPALETVPEFDNREIGFFFLSIGLLMWFTLFTTTFHKVVTTHNSDGRNRNLIFIWVAAPAVAGIAAVVLQSVDTQSLFFKFTMYTSLILLWVVTWTFMPYLSFLGSEPFGMSYWSFVFPLDTVAAIFMLDNLVNPTPMNQVLTFIFLSLASIVTAILFQHTALALFRKKIFTPEVKWGPLSFMKLTHEAFRGAMDNLNAACEKMTIDNPASLYKFAALYHDFSMLHEEHAKHEDEIIFKLFNDFFPEHARKWNDDHAQGHRLSEQWEETINTILNKDAPEEERRAKISVLQQQFPSFLESIKEHLKGEEDNLNPIGRKLVPLALQKQLSRKVFEFTPASKWEVIIPFIINNMPRHGQRVRYIRVLCWSMPERAQQIGAIIYRNCDSVMYERLRKDCPQIIPRGLPNWHRYY